MWLLVQSFEKHASDKSRHHGRLTWHGSGRSQVVAVSSILDWVMEVVAVSSILDWVMEVVAVSSIQDWVMEVRRPRDAVDFAWLCDVAAVDAGRHVAHPSGPFGPVLLVALHHNLVDLLRHHRLRVVQGDTQAHRGHHAQVNRLMCFCRTAAHVAGLSFLCFSRL